MNLLSLWCRWRGHKFGGETRKKGVGTGLKKCKRCQATAPVKKRTKEPR